jgi:hypothetical protein
MKKIRRIVVKVDSARRRRAVLEAAAALAEKLEAELVGLFVENVDLLHFAGLPFAREVGHASAVRRPLDVAAMERSLRALAKEAEETLALIAGATPVRWSFRVARGPEAPELLAAAMDEDLVIANAPFADDLARGAAVRVVRAGDWDELRAALEEEPGGILVLAGADDALVRETLRRLREGDGK